MENKENIKRLVDDLASINRDLDRKPGSILTPLQVDALEKRLYENSGIEVRIQSRSDFKQLEEYYRKKLMLQNDVLTMEEGWIKADKPIDEYPVGTKYRAIGGGHWTKLDVGRYKWCTGNIFPRVGGDWSGYVMLPKERCKRKIEFESEFNIGDRVTIKLKCKLTKPVTGRILGIFYSETADPWEEYPKCFDTIAKKVMYRIMLDDTNDREMRDLEASHYSSEDLELIQ